MNNVVDVAISNFCNFGCSYCISGATRTKVPTNPDGTVRRFVDLRYNERGMVDHSRVRKYGLIVRGNPGDTYNYGILNADGTIDRSGDHVIENDYIDMDRLVAFLRNSLPNWVVQVGGGEPLHNPGIDDLLIELTKTHKVILSTNLSLINAHTRILDIPNDRLFYRVGFHPTQTTLDVYLRNISLLKSHGKQYIANFVLHPMYEIDGMGKAYVDFLRDNDITHEITRFKGEYKGINYPTTELNMMERELLSRHASDLTLYKMSPSTPGTSMLTIYPDGNIYQCPKKTVWLGDIYGRRSFSTYNRMPLPRCFGDQNKCQSAVSQAFACDTFGI